jgi:hypothetical protein
MQHLAAETPFDRLVFALFAETAVHFPVGINDLRADVLMLARSAPRSSLGSRLAREFYAAKRSREARILALRETCDKYKHGYGFLDCSADGAVLTESGLRAKPRYSLDEFVPAARPYTPTPAYLRLIPRFGRYVVEEEQSFKPAYTAWQGVVDAPRS